ncbi:nitroreductase/quinone reductase family protein [Mycolicibacterium frederiksbergense]|uniref:nitroreductase/quinone reductase family protein n=1 Tax=Mycolicibacterium frederiksbergense TaxID=117567 RepID=UPI003999DDF0
MTTHEIGYHDADAPWNQEKRQDPSNWNDDVVAEFRAKGGQVGGDYAGHPLILLTTTGARSGEPRVVPLAPNYRGDTLYLSSFREDRDPDWFHNIRANPAVTVEIGTETRQGTATTLAGAEYVEFADWVRRNNQLLTEFQATLDRPVPLVTIRFA